MMIETQPPPESDTDASKAPPPVVSQYLAIKEEYPDCLLFYRLGDFYEMFFDDAVAAAAALDIVLTRRGRHQGRDIPMCGVPVRSHAAYLRKLTRLGFKVAVCEQMEDPAEARKRGSRSPVDRAVDRVVTAGTLIEDELLESRRNNFLAAVAEAEGRIGLAWVDMSTGEFQVQEVPTGGLAAVLARLAPSELLVSDRMLSSEALAETFDEWKKILSPLPPSRFDSTNGARRLETLYSVKALDAFGAFSRGEIAAAGALVDYIELTQRGRMPRLGRPRRLALGAVMEIDTATRRNLELTETQSGETRGSLRAVIDRTLTGAGARLLNLMLSAPLTDPAIIDERLDAVQLFVDAESMRTNVREKLRHCPDIERALSRLTLGRGGPRDLAAIRDALSKVPGLRITINREPNLTLPPLVQTCLLDLGNHGILCDLLARALAPDPPLTARDGKVIQVGYDLALDRLKNLESEGLHLIAQMESRYAKETEIPSLKIRHNNVIGYFIEVTAKQADKLMADTRFIHRQTMVNAARFTTIELSELENNIRGASAKALAMELELFGVLVGEVTSRSEDIASTAHALARLDVASSLAELAVERNYHRPVVDRSLDFAITGGRHPVVEVALNGPFVANDCTLAPKARLWLLTGPNMAGKSTFLRQNALIAVLAQAGSFVPALSARIGVIDRLFSRVGAADDLARGRSTFMVEMVETAVILNQASERSLVILDEIGRGTATYDGLSIAWATVEHLHDISRCRALFATHYHELTALAEQLDRLVCYTMCIKEWKDDVIFLHEVAPGTADRSYGIHVAKLAGLPEAVIARSVTILARLEAGGRASTSGKQPDDLPLFAAARHYTPPPTPTPSAVEVELRAIIPDEMTPRLALELVYRLRNLLRPE